MKPLNVQALNLNYWITKEQSEDLFFRFDGEDVRAIFTPRYIPTDNISILEELVGLDYAPETPVHCSLDGEFMSLNIPDGNRTFEVTPGDRMTPGILPCHGQYLPTHFVNLSFAFSIITSTVSISGYSFSVFCQRR